MSRNPERRGRVRSSRMPGIDLARFLAIVGMIAVHTLQVTAPNPVLDLSNGNASTLFAVLAGVGAALASRAALQAGATATARLALVARGAGLVGLGLLLGLMPSPAVVILVYLGVTFVVMAAFIRARS